MKKLLFIAWDGPQVYYLEGLFYPIFDEVRKQIEIEFHIIQFTWGDENRIKYLQEYSKQLGFIYTPAIITRQPYPAIGAYWTVFRSKDFLKKYIRENKIDIVMPRSTMPAMMINQLLLTDDVKIIFDADGLPIEERVDFAGLKKGSWMYRFLSREEKKILIKADAVITRSNKAIDIHINEIGEIYRNKFYRVINGKNTRTFIPNLQQREDLRNNLGIKTDEKVFVYCGSLGEQYCWDEMQGIFIRYLNINPHSQFLILTGSPHFLEGKITQEYSNRFIVKTVPAEDVPAYLNVADIAFAIRKPTFSMQGVAPIKLAEYLLMGLPTIASKDIGDTEDLLKNIPDCFLYDHFDSNRINKAVHWILHKKPNKEILSQSVRNIFSLEKSAEDYLSALDAVIQ